MKVLKRMLKVAGQQLPKAVRLTVNQIPLLNPLKTHKHIGNLKKKTISKNEK